MGVVGLHHAGVYVSNLERSIAFYGDVFGLELAERLSLDGEEIAFLSVGSARLELIQSGSGPRPDGVVDHVAFEVNNLDVLVQQLRERRVSVLDSVPLAVPALGARIVFCLGPDAERIELFEGQYTGPELD
jgi:lactoylglutathione lyase